MEIFEFDTDFLAKVAVQKAASTVYSGFCGMTKYFCKAN